MAKVENTFYLNDQMSQKLSRIDSMLTKMNKNMETTHSRSGSMFSGMGMNILSLEAGIQLVTQAVQSLRGLFDMNDILTNSISKINLINDGLQDNVALNKMVLDSANNTRSSYEAMVQFASRLSFTNAKGLETNKKQLDFAEQINKMLIISGAGAQEAQSTLLQLGQALGAGRLQGDEFRSLAENAPLLMVALAKSTGKPIGALKQMGAEGQLTSDLIIKAVTDMKNVTDTQFKGMEMTTGQWGQIIKNNLMSVLSKAGGFFDIINKKLANFAQWLSTPQAGIFAQQVGQAMSDVATAVFTLMSIVQPFISFLINNLPTVKALIISVVAVKGWYMLATAISFVIPYLYSMRTAVYGLSLAFNSLGAVIKTNIVGIAITVIILLISWIYQLWQTNIKFRVGFKQIWGDISLTVANTANFIINSINMMIDALNTFASEKDKMGKLSLWDIEAIKKDTKMSIAYEYKMAKTKKAENVKIPKVTIPQGGGLSNVNVKGGTLDGIKTKIDVSEDSIKYLQSIANREFAIKLNQITPQINYTHKGDVNDKSDVNKIIGDIDKLLNRAVNSDTAQGIYNY
jgi:tape measure domain-containing protein